MSLRYFLCIVLSFIPFLVWSQGSPEELERRYADSSEVAKISALLSTGKDLFMTNRQQSLLFIERTLALSENKDAFRLQHADAYNMKGLILMYGERFDEAEVALNTSLQLSESGGLPTIKRKALGNLALNAMKRGDYQGAVKRNLELIPILDKAGDKSGLASTSGNLAAAYTYLQQFAQSNRYAEQALQLFTELKQPRGIATSLNTLGNNYTELDNFPQAIKYLKESIALKDPNENSDAYGNTAVTISTLYYRMHNNDESERWLKVAEESMKRHGQKAGLAKVYTNWGTLYARKGDYAAAQKMEERALELSGKGADHYMKSAIYRDIAENYARLRDSASAYAYSLKSARSQDSVIDLTIQQQLNELETQYQTAKKEQLLQQQRFDIQRKNYLLAGSAALLLLGTSLAYSIYRRQKLRAQAKMHAAVLAQQEAATKAILEAEEAERSRIAKDLHDGVGQMMSAAKMNLSAYESDNAFKTPEERVAFEKIISLVDESCKEVRAVSHNMMPNALLKNSLAAAIREFINQIDQRKLKVHLYTEGLDQRLDANTEAVLYRVVQECVNNVIKHSGANTLDISLVKEADEITATVEDNGRGFDTKKTGVLDGIGLKNIRTRVDFLKGTVDFDSSPGRGTVVAVHVPLA